MQFHAASLGEAVPRENFNAWIHSVFDSAVNLRLAHEDRLVTVLLSDHYELPQGIRIAAKGALFHSLTLNLRAAARGGVLRFDSSALTVDLRGAPVWRCPVRELHLDMSRSSAQAAWSRAWELLNKGQRTRSTDIVADLLQQNRGSTLNLRMSRPVMELITAAEELDVEASIRAARQMIGLGPGVTPSGDDILIGFLAALWSQVAGDKPRSAFLHSFGDALSPLTMQTSEISRTYLYHAIRGKFSSSLSNLAEAIAGGVDVAQETREAMRVGHSSGMDSVTGLLLGLRTWNTSRPALIARVESNSSSHHKEDL